MDREASRILYIDDDVGNLEVLRATCEDTFVVDTASAGAEGLALLRSREYAVLLADQRMPGMTGVEVLERAREIAPDTERILITAYSDITDAIAAINRGHVRRYLRKPWDPDELIATLRDAAEMFENRRRLERLEGQLRESERVYALGVIAAGIAHELRNPVSVLSARISLTRGKLDKVRSAIEAVGAGPEAIGAVDVAHEFLESASKAAEQITEITRGIELGQRRRDEEQDADLRDVLRQTVRTMRGSLLKKATLELEEGEPAWVRGSPTKLGQITLNLLVNALQALPGDRPRAENRIRVDVAPEAGRVRLTVEDNGPGIPPDVLERVFDPFFTTKVQGGTGLGLPISKRIVEELGGTLEAENAEGGGARFVVRLPAAERRES